MADRLAPERGHASYLPFVDGLRAVSILAVVGSHIDMPGFAGGYVGVDVFFVISGFLIINQIVADIERDRFSFFRFGARRVLRILPAFLLVMLTCLVLVTTVFVQPEYKDFAESFFFSALMVVNHHFLAQQGYFDMAAFTKPLLHMWSLAVEEQFYLLAPPILLGLTAATAKLGPERGRRAWNLAALGIAVLSFAACVAFTYPAGRANTAFYITPTRGWEFIAGGAAASLSQTLRRWPAWISDVLAVLGIAAIAFAIVAYDSDTLYPSYRATAPALGAMLVIASGLVRPGNIVARALATPPMVGIGLVSYAWYLWHWPLISFVRTMSFGGRDLTKEIAAAALALLLAVLTYWFVEVPVRRWRRRQSVRPVVVALAGPACCIVVALVGYGWSMKIAPRMLPEIAGLEFHPVANGDAPPATHRAMLLGDSHANILHEPFQDYARSAGASLAVVARAGCPPLLQTAVTDQRGVPQTYCEPFFKSIAFDGMEGVVIVARWNFYLDLPPSDPFFRSFVLVDPKGASHDPYAILLGGLRATITQAQRAGVRRILVMGPLPEFPVHPPYCLMRSLRTGIDSCTIARAGVDARRARTMETLVAATSGLPDVRLIDPIDVFCGKTTCQPQDGRTLYFRDSNHLSPAGAERLFKAFDSDLRWALTGQSTGRPSARLD